MFPPFTHANIASTTLTNTHFITIDLASIVLDKCITREEVDNNGTPCTTQMVYNYEFIDDADEPKLTKVGKFVLNTVLRYKTKRQERDIPLIVISNHQLENGKENTQTSSSSITSVRQSSITSGRHSSITSGRQSSITSTRHSSLQSAKQLPIISPVKDWGPKVYEKDNHTLTLMVILSDI